MARSLDSIIQELDAGYNPSRQLINQRLSELPAQGDAEIAGLQATQTQAFDDILGGARQRGLGFSGIPVAEQARYSATNFLPAVARVKQSQNDTKTSLLDAINNTNLDQRKTAMSIYQTELDRDEAMRQYNQARADQLAAEARALAARAGTGGAAGSFNPTFDVPPGAPPKAAPVAPQVDADYITVRQILDTNDMNRVKQAIATQRKFTSGVTKVSSQAAARARKQLTYFKQLLGEATYRQLGGV